MRPFPPLRSAVRSPSATGLAVSLWALASAAPAAAQTTPTERAAARDVVAAIDVLQEELAPGALAARLATGPDPERDRILARVDEIWRGPMVELSDHIGRNPEVGFQEYETVDTLATVLRAHDYGVELGVAGLETAFVGSWDSPAGTDGPTLGVIVEYDALRGTREPFHGCQHNAQSPVGFAAAFALQEHMARAGVPGRIRIYGTPAEEMGPPSKAIMHEAGIFDEADVLVRSHGRRCRTARPPRGRSDRSRSSAGARGRPARG